MISSKYGEGTFDFYGNDITITISFRFINEVGNNVGNNVGNKTEENGLNKPPNMKLSFHGTVKAKRRVMLKRFRMGNVLERKFIPNFIPNFLIIFGW